MRRFARKRKRAEGDAPAETTTAPAPTARLHLGGSESGAVEARRHLPLLTSDSDLRLFSIATQIQERAAERPSLSGLVLASGVLELEGYLRFGPSAPLAGGSVPRWSAGFPAG
jgi:hypothetical protein